MDKKNTHLTVLVTVSYPQHLILPIRLSTIFNNSVITFASLTNALLTRPELVLFNNTFNGSVPRTVIAPAPHVAEQTLLWEE